MYPVFISRVGKVLFFVGIMNLIHSPLYAEEIPGVLKMHRDIPLLGGSEIFSDRFAHPEISGDTQSQFYTFTDTRVVELGDCNKITKTLEEAAVQPLRDSGIFLDYSFYCMPSGKKSYVVSDVRVEPYYEQSVSRLKEILSRLEGIDVFGIPIHFRRVVSMTMESYVRLQDPSGEVYWQSPRYSEKFESYLDFKKFLDTERDFFYLNQDPSVYRGYVLKKLGENSYRVFEKLIPKANLAGTVYWPTFLYENGDTKESALGVGTVRFCWNVETPC